MKSLINFLKDESGASAAEYVLILAIVGGTIVTAVTGLGTAISTELGEAATKISGSITP